MGAAAGQVLLGKALSKPASICARTGMPSEPARCPCTRGAGVLAPMGMGQNQAGLRAREWSLTVSALSQHPYSLNHRSFHPFAHADQTSRWLARRLSQKGGQVLLVWIAPILVPALHPYPSVTLFQPLFRGRSHFGADFVSGAARQFGAWESANMQAKAAVLEGGEWAEPPRWLLSPRKGIDFRECSKGQSVV